MLRIRDLVLVAAVGAVVAPASLSAENRDSWRTNAGEEITVRGTREGSRTSTRVVDATVEVESSRDGRVIVKTTRGERMTLGNVPVEYQGDQYKVSDLERGDRIRIFFEPSSDGRPRARRIEVLRSVSDRDASSDRSRRGDRDEDDDRDRRGRSRDVRRETSRDRDRNALTGQVTSVNDRNETFVIATEDGREIRVDAYELFSRHGSSAGKIRRGDHVSLRGEFIAGGAFRAREIASRGSGDRRRVISERGVRRGDDRTDRNRNWRDSDRRKNDDDDEDDDEDDEDDDEDDDDDDNDTDR
ncbi:MAG TPA: DUF5666 domain-containing protein [Thermoanaerobaculia bacterium]|nr:DUF5666 domain-containing protein [Thermoanaerobaculia bacterium]